MHLSGARLRALNALVRAGSVTNAARELGVSQPAVSQAIRDLERDAGVVLFERRGRELVPTPLCTELYRKTSEAQRLESEAEALLMRHANREVGEFRVGLGNANPGMAMVAAFRGAMPNVQIQIEFGSWAQIIDAVVQGRVDVGVLPNVPDDSRFIRRVCLVQDIIALVPTSHAFARRSQVSLEELGREPLIFRTPHSSTQHVVDEGFRSVGLAPVPTMILDTRDGVYEAVTNRLGIGFAWESASTREEKVRKVRIIGLKQGHPEHVFSLAGSKNPLTEIFSEIRT